MKFFFACMLAGFLISLYFLLTDSSGSGMGWGVGAFGGIAAAVALYNQIKFGSIFNDGTQA